MRQKTTHYSHVAIKPFRYPDSPVGWYIVETIPPREDIGLCATIGVAYKEVQRIHTYNRYVPKKS